jgi:hypothetical protein
MNASSGRAKERPLVAVERNLLLLLLLLRMYQYRQAPQIRAHWRSLWVLVRRLFVVYAVAAVIAVFLTLFCRYAGADWKATSQGKNRWVIVAPTGEKFKSRKAAMEFMLGSTVTTGSAVPATVAIEKVPAVEGDPPWRTIGHEYLGRQVLRVANHRVSSRRTVSIEQPGTVVGWISEDDVDKKGSPGFVSEKTGRPAKLFHVKYEVDKHTAHADFQLEMQDLEEYELLDIILPPGEKYVPPRKDALYG